MSSESVKEPVQPKESPPTLPGPRPPVRFRMGAHVKMTVACALFFALTVWQGFDGAPLYLYAIVFVLLVAGIYLRRILLLAGAAVAVLVGSVMKPVLTPTEEKTSNWAAAVIPFTVVDAESKEPIFLATVRVLSGYREAPAPQGVLTGPKGEADVPGMFRHEMTTTTTGWNRETEIRRTFRFSGCTIEVEAEGYEPLHRDLADYVPETWDPDGEPLQGAVVELRRKADS